MKLQIQLIAATLALTVLIWVYADLASHEAAEIRLPVQLMAPVGSDAVIHVEAQGATSDARTNIIQITATVSGSKSAIAEMFREQRRQAIAPLEVPIAAGDVESSARLRSVDIREVVKAWARQRSLHLAEELTRPTINYRVDRYVWKDLTVKADAGAARQELEADPRVEPAKIKMRLLASQLDQYASAEPLLTLDIQEQLAQRLNDRFDMPLAGVRWNGLDVTYQPDIVSVIVQRGQGFVTHRINTIRLNEVWPAYRPDGEYRIVWADDEEKVQHIEVKVPRGKPLPTNQDVIAYVQIDREDLEAATLTTDTTQTAPAAGRAELLKEVHFVFDEPFKDVRLSGPPPVVRLRVARLPTDQPAQTTP